MKHRLSNPPINAPIYMALGANLSNPKLTFQACLSWLEKNSFVKVVKISGLWKSPSWPPGQGHPDYLNAAAQLEFSGAPEALLEVFLRCEHEFGRKRLGENAAKNTPRSLDLDIIDFKSKIITRPGLILPHPRATERSFVLLPLQQIAPNWQDPNTGLSVEALIARLPLSTMEQITYKGRLGKRK